MGYMGRSREQGQRLVDTSKGCQQMGTCYKVPLLLQRRIGMWHFRDWNPIRTRCMRVTEHRLGGIVNHAGSAPRNKGRTKVTLRLARRCNVDFGNADVAQWGPIARLDLATEEPPPRQDVEQVPRAPRPHGRFHLSRGLEGEEHHRIL
jgi:hypothetical protein